jgi:hypothetical protein
MCCPYLYAAIIFVLGLEIIAVNCFKAAWADVQLKK